MKKNKACISTILIIAMISLTFFTDCILRVEQTETDDPTEPDDPVEPDDPIKNWRFVGNPGINNEGEDVGSETKLFIENGTPYIAYTEGPFLEFRLTVKKFNGGEWIAVGNRRFTGQQTSDISLYVERGIPYVSFTDISEPSLSPKVMKYEGGIWQYVGGEVTDEESYYTSIVVYNGTPYISYARLTDKRITLKKYEENNWITLGQPGFSPGDVFLAPLFIENGKLYVAYRDNDQEGRATVVVYNEAEDQWQALGEAGFSNGPATMVSLYIYNSIVYAGFCDENNDRRITVMKYISSNGTWEIAGEEGISPSLNDGPLIFIDSGIPYTAYLQCVSGKDYRPTVKRFNENENIWEVLGSECFTTFTTIGASLFVYNGVPYISFTQEGISPWKIHVMKYE